MLKKLMNGPNTHTHAVSDSLCSRLVRCRMEHCRNSDSATRSTSSLTDSPALTAAQLSGGASANSSHSPSVASQSSRPSSGLQPGNLQSVDDRPAIRKSAGEKRRRQKSSLSPAISMDVYARPHLPHCRLYRALDLQLYEKYKAG